MTTQRGRFSGQAVEQRRLDYDHALIDEDAKFEARQAQ